MKTNKKLNSVALASSALVLFLILVSSAASAATAQSAPFTITETRITTSESAIHSAIYGERIVWEDYRDENFRNIYMYNLSTHKESQVTKNESNQGNPAIYGDKIVYEDDRNGYPDIYMYDLSTHKETQITTDKSDQSIPAIYGNKIVWEDWRNGEDKSDIYMYDLSTHKETKISTSGSAGNPAIYGDRIVWDEGRDRDGYKNCDIYMYDLSTSKKTRITTSGSSCVPKIDGDRIMWRYKDVTISPNISVYDLSTHKETKITTDEQVGYATICGDKVVWTERYPGIGDIQQYDLYMYDLSTHKETQITTNGSPKGKVSMFQNRIIWTDYRNSVNDPYQDPYSNPDIYMITLDSSSPVADYSASPTSGKVPLTVVFTDKSTGSPTSWKWSFGDGSPLTTEHNPTHTYSKAGIYTVMFTATNAAGSNTKTKTNYIKVTAVIKPVAAFSASPTSGKAPLNVQFTDKSTGKPTKWAWAFGDGEKSSVQNPKHQYLQEGNYKVTLKVTNTAGSSTTTKTNYIKVTTNTRPGIYSKNVTIQPM